MKMYPWEQPFEDPEQACFEAADHVPQTTSWGYFAEKSFDNGPPVSWGAFYWFDTLPQLFQHIVQAQLYDRVDPRLLAQVLRVWHSGTQDPSKAFELLEQYYPVGFEVFWFGSFSALLHENTPGAQHWRSRFREAEGAVTENATAPLDKNEVADFILFLKRLGEEG